MLVERYQPMAFCLALRLVREQETAHDLVQEALLQAFLSLHRLQNDERFQNWLYGIVLNLCRNWLRGRPEHHSSLDLLLKDEASSQFSQISLNPRGDPQELLEKRELQQIVREAVAVLSLRNREVAYLFYYEDLSMQEIATRLGITLSAVKNRLHKGREQLRLHLQKTQPDFAFVPRRNRRTPLMLPLTIFHIIEQHESFSDTFTLFFLDEQQRRLFPLRIIESRPPSFSPPNATTSEPLTLDLVEQVLHALNGTLQEVAITTLWEDLLYSKITFRGPGGVHALNARLYDGLVLALHLHATISVSEEIFERRAVLLSELGTTREQQLAEALQRAQSGSLFLAKKTINLDLSDGLRGWLILALPDEAVYGLDPTTPYAGKASLALSLFKGRSQGSLLVLHEGFSADAYRGKRVRLRAYVKAEGDTQAKLNLKIVGALLDPQPQIPHMHAGSQGMHMGYIAHAKIKQMEENSDWLLHEMVINVPEDGTLMSVMLGMEKPGKIWMSGMVLDMVDATVPLTGTEMDPPSLKPLNLDFQDELEFWQIGGSTPDAYEVGVEEIPTSPGGLCAYLRSDRTEPGGTVKLQQRLLALSFQGKQLRLSAQIKTTNVKQARLFIQTGLISEKIMDEKIEGTTDWQPYQVILPISEQTWLLHFGLTLHGKGQAWIKDIQLQVLGPSEN